MKLTSFLFIFGLVGVPTMYIVFLVVIKKIVILVFASDGDGDEMDKYFMFLLCTSLVFGVLTSIVCAELINASPLSAENLLSDNDLLRPSEELEEELELLRDKKLDEIFSEDPMLGLFYSLALWVGAFELYGSEIESLKAKKIGSGKI